MALSERQQSILDALKEKKSVNVKTLARILYVSEATIRRDLTEMQKLGLLERNHGGAMLSESANEVSIFFRMQKNAAEKEKVASLALPHIPSFRSVFIDSSSTALLLAERLDLSCKTVVTNNLQAALKLSRKKDIHLLLLGGTVQYNTNSATGSFTTEQLGGFSFDLMLSSCSAIKNTESLERSPEQTHIKKKAFERSDVRILLADRSKFDAFASFKVADLKDYDLVVTDLVPDNPEVFEGIRLVHP